MEMGLYDDAWELYTQRRTIRTVFPPALELGMLLMVMKNDMATACLEEKVASSKYPKDKFFETLDRGVLANDGRGKGPDLCMMPC